MAVTANKQVWGKVTGLSLDREGNVLNVTWKVPPAMKHEEYHDRAEWLLGEVNFVLKDGKIAQGTVHASNIGSPVTTEDATVTLTHYYNHVDGISLANKLEATFSRNWFHPLRTSKHLDRVSVGIRGQNSSGKAGETVWASRKMAVPYKPKVTWEYDETNQRATVTVVSDEGEAFRHKHDTMRRITIRKQDGKTAVLADWGATQNTEYTYTVDLSTYIAGLTSGKYVQVKCEAYSRGMGGDSAVTEAVRNVALPVAATIGTIKCDRKTATGRIEVQVKPGAYTLEVQLQRRNGDSGSWSDVSGATDNWDCKALYDSYGEADPQPGEYVYYRVKTTRDGYTVYSAAKRADCLYTAKPKVVCSATVGIVSTSPAKSGTSATVVMGYTDSTTNTGCELSWSDDYNAWSSTEGPSTATFTGNDTNRASTKYAKSRTVTMSDLTSGTVYYVRMRRYREVDGETLYSAYSSRASFRTESATDDTCGIASVSCGSNGETATIVVGINEDNANTGTEITWSDHSSAWWSNEQPESLNATWGRAAYGEGGWTYKQTTYLRGLTPGTTYYIRARRYLDAGGNTTYTPYSKTASFRTPKKTDADPDLRCGLVSVTGGEDGVSAEVVVGWSGDRDGCEVSWSTDPDAWQSSVQPDTATFDWKDKARRSTAWSKTGTFYLHGLEEGTTYYVKARTYIELDGETVYSDYTQDKSVTPYSSPASVALSAPSAIARGESIELYWTLESELEQTEWRVHRVGYPKTSLASGTGSLCHASIPKSRYGSLASISLYVEAGYGGGLTESNAVTVGIADVPTCEATCNATLTAQPASFDVETDNPAASLLVTVMSEGVTWFAPDGERDQLPGDIVWTSAVRPEWAEDDGAYTATVTMPSMDTFVDGGKYTVLAQTVEPVAGLVSDPSTASFTVAWAHQAQMPPDAVSITADKESRSVTIALAAPTGSAQTDVYDVYRKGPTGYSLVAFSLAMDDTVTDPYAPYGKKADLDYRVCLRTVDGDLCFRDYPYEMKVQVLRVDWDGGYVELPYNLGLTESRAKSFESRGHVDGSVTGRWDKAIETKSSYSSDVIAVNDFETANAVRSLGEHAGACFVRDATGMAFQANVDVPDVTTSYGAPGKVEVRLDATVVATDEAFWVKDGEGAGA